MSVTADSATGSVYALGRGDSAITFMQRMDAFDATGMHRVSGGCTKGCLMFRNVFAEKALRATTLRTQPPSLSRPAGLAGGRAVRMCGADVCVTTGVFPDEYTCGDVPPLSAKEEQRDEGNAQCQNINFTLSTFGSVTPEMFETAPYVNDRGVLLFRPAPGMFGDGVFSLDLSDGGGGMEDAERRVFVISVVPVNDPPIFEVCSCGTKHTHMRAHTHARIRKLTFCRYLIFFVLARVCTCLSVCVHVHVDAYFSFCLCV